MSEAIVPKNKSIRNYFTIAACTVASLACGTIYVYSAYSVQLADRLHFSALQSSLIGTTGTLGMSLNAIPGGIIIDKYGTRRPAALACTLICLGWTSLYLCYTHYIDNVWLVCAAYFTAASGSTVVFSSAIKASALSFPESRGTATSLPLSACGLSALFFSIVASLLYKGNTQGFLKLLAVLTTLMTSSTVYFFKVSKENKLRAATENNTEPRVRRPNSVSSSGTNTPRILASGSVTPRTSSSSRLTLPSTETSALIAKHNSYINFQSVPIYEEGHVYEPSPEVLNSEECEIVWEDSNEMDPHHHKHLSGLQLLKDIHFWQLTLLLGLTAGAGQMYIYSCGYCVRALTRISDPDMTPNEVQALQALQVGVVSLFNCLGRLTSGSLSDFLVKKHGLQRLWLMVLSISLGIVAHTLAANLSEPSHLWKISICIGYYYGLMFGVCPSIVSESFGLRHFSQNWGCVGFTPVVTSYMFNLMFGKVYDSHSDSSHTCRDGLACYASSFRVSSTVMVCSLILALYMIYAKRHENLILYRARQGLL